MTYSAKTDWKYDDLVTEQDLNRIEGGIANLHSRLDEESREEITLKPGMQVVTAKQNASFSLGSIKGRTLVNLLGRAGVFPDLHSIFSIGNHSAALDENNKTVGVHGLKVTSTGAGDGAPGNLIRIGNDTFEDEGSYIILMDARADTSITLHAELWGNKGNVFNKDINTSWQTLVYRCKGSSGGKGFYVWNASPKAATFYLSGVRIYKVSDDDYLDSDSNLIDKYPYVDSIQPVRNPYAIRYGENLLPPFYEWTFTNHKTRLISDYEIEGELMATEMYTDGYAVHYFDVLEGQRYSIFNPKLNGILRITFYADKTKQIRISTKFINPGENVLLTVPPNSVCAGLILSGITSYTDEFDVDQWVWTVGTKKRFVNPMMTIGDTAKPFKPREDAMIALQTDLYADPVTREEADEVFLRDGHYYKISKWRNVVLDGSESWNYFGSFSGVKKVSAKLNQPSSAASFDKQCITKFNGQLVSIGIGGTENTGNFNGVDNLEFDKRIFLSISNSDSGWGDNYIPTSNEIKAYFMGWKMYDTSGIGTIPAYDRSDGTDKGWVRRDDDGNFVDGTGTLPTSKASDWNYYQLLYQLAKPVVEPIVSEGQLTLFEGENLIQIGTGIKLREKANVQGNALYSGYYINEMGTLPASKLSNKVDKIFAVYKNSMKDNWRIITGNSYGNEQAFKRFEEYDQSAAYSVTYLMQGKSLVAPFIGTFATNEKALLNDLIKNNQKNIERLSVIENTKPDKEAPMWIIPTLLNGWIHYNPSNDIYPTTRFYKDNLGYVHMDGMIAGGATTPGVTLFILPVGYRPKKAISYATVCSDVLEGTMLGRIRINPDGIVMLARSGNVYLSTAIPSFLAEQ